ncbi:MAG TPA: response regulator [Candidatus Angelobacter sp.]|nr:response regulator [Candidatus Angelobacter sp.]
MSLRILFADDSVTAQNMGRKILTDAGYEVVAVSNGAAAVKKIAEQKPDIIILDVYMPGYSGLEVCEKVRGSVATLKTPVLLTVGKMEPYKPEETSRVRADGVIVKPFEASDLLAIVKKFEERIGQEPLVPEPVTAERFSESAPDELAMEHPDPIIATPQQATVDVPDHMATSSAFSDLLGTDPAHAMNNFSAPPVMRESAPPVMPETPPEPTPIRNPIPEYGVPVSWREQIDGEAEPFSAAVPAANDAKKTEAGARPMLQIPVYHEQEEAAAPAEVVPTAAPPTGEIEIPRDPALQESAAEQTRSTIADAREPGLIPTYEEEERERPAAAATVAPPSGPAEIPMPSFAEAMASAPPATAANDPAVAHFEEPAVTEANRIEDEDIEAEKTAVSDSDFEARVAAAMSAYSSAAESGPSQEPTVSGAKAVSEPESVSSSHFGTPSAVMESAPAEAVNAARVHSEAQAAAPPFDYHPPDAYTGPAPAADSVAAADIGSLPVAHEPVPPPAPEATHRNETFGAAQAMAASVEAAVPLVASAAAGAGVESDHHNIAQAVHRVMERLKPELVEEILRELKPKE